MLYYPIFFGHYQNPWTQKSSEPGSIREITQGFEHCSSAEMGFISSDVGSSFLNQAVSRDFQER